VGRFEDDDGRLIQVILPPTPMWEVTVGWQQPHTVDETFVRYEPIAMLAVYENVHEGYQSRGAGYIGRSVNPKFRYLTESYWRDPVMAFWQDFHKSDDGYNSHLLGYATGEIDEQHWAEELANWRAAWDRKEQKKQRQREYNAKRKAAKAA